MSTASHVPETWELTGDDARATLRACGRWTLVRDAYMRLRVADGFSHARSLAYLTSLVLVQSIIALVGLASSIGKADGRDLVVRTIEAAVPGPGGRLLTDAVRQAHTAGANHRYFALTFGLIGAVITGTTLMGQVERALNRIYGVEQDRPTAQKYGFALVLAVTTGLLAIVSFTLLAFGRAIGHSIQSNSLATAWAVLRWPAALVCIVLAITLLFRYSPRRHQPHLSWLMFGAGVAVLLWVACTALLGLFFAWSKSFGQTYGPLAGVVGLLLWALLSSVAILLGGAVAAQLEAVRAGAREPQDPEKVEHSEPDLVTVHTPPEGTPMVEAGRG